MDMDIDSSFFQGATVTFFETCVTCTSDSDTWCEWGGAIDFNWKLNKSEKQKEDERMIEVCNYKRTLITEPWNDCKKSTDGYVLCLSFTKQINWN